jgi:hypothetical protein
MNNLQDMRVYLLGRLSALSLQKPTGTLNELPITATPIYKQLELQLSQLLSNASKADLKRIRSRIPKEDKVSAKWMDDYLALVAELNRKGKRK